jgi:hypothetical protein
MMRSFFGFVTLAVLLLCQPLYSGIKKIPSSKPGLDNQETAFDFGHVGIDFKLFHTYALVNWSETPIKVTGIYVPCDCSSVTALDSLINPGDTGFFRLTFSTKDYYGPTRKSFKVFTDHPEIREEEYFYQSIIGQWLDYIKPSPTSLFFLPPHRTTKVVIANPSYDEITVTVEHQYDTTFNVTLLKDKAGRGDSLELEISPRPNLKKGTYGSNVTLRVDKGPAEEPTILTIPIKIVRY